MINGNGDRWDLNKLDSFASNPTFGFKASRSYTTYKRNRKSVVNGMDLGEFKFTLITTEVGYPGTNDYRTAYQHRYDWFKFLTYTPLQVEYHNDNGVFLKNIELSDHPYNEMTSKIDGFVDEVIFDELSPWYQFVTSEDFTPLDVGVYGKTFWVDNNNANGGYYTYAYTFSRSAIQTSDNDIIYNSKSDTFLQDKMSGEILLVLQPTSRTVNITNRVKGQVISSDGFNIPNSLQPSEYTLTYSTFEEDINAYLTDKDTEVKTSAYQYQDLTRMTYVKFQIGETNHLTVEGANIVSWQIREVHDAV